MAESETNTNISQLKTSLETGVGDEYSKAVHDFFLFVGKDAEYTEREDEGSPDIIVIESRPSIKYVFIIECYGPHEGTNYRAGLAKIRQLQDEVEKISQNEEYEDFIKKPVLISKYGFTDEVINRINDIQSRQEGGARNRPRGIALLTNEDLFLILKFIDGVGKIIPSLTISQIMMTVGPAKNKLEKELKRIAFFIDVQAIGLYLLMDLFKSNGRLISSERFEERIKTFLKLAYPPHPKEWYHEAVNFLLYFLTSPSIRLISFDQETKSLLLHDYKFKPYLENCFGELGKAIIRRYSEVHEYVRGVSPLKSVLS